MDLNKEIIYGFIVCLVMAIPCWWLGNLFPIIGGLIVAIMAGMLISLVWNEKGKASDGINFTSKYILHLAVVLLGFGLNLAVIVATGISLFQLS